MEKVMPRPIDYIEGYQAGGLTSTPYYRELSDVLDLPSNESFVSSVADETSVHHNIDNLIMDSEIFDKYYKNPPLWKDVGYPVEGAVPINMSHYADIMEDANISKAIQKTIWENPPVGAEGWKGNEWTTIRERAAPASIRENIQSITGKPIYNTPGMNAIMREISSSYADSINQNILNKMRKGDVPGGLVAYNYPSYMKKRGRGLYKFAKNEELSPDTIKFFMDYPTDEEGTVMHEPLHAEIRHGEKQYPHSFTDYPSFSIMENSMLKSLDKKYGESLFDSHMRNLLKSNMRPISSTVSSVFDRILQ
jgi:hypothetical protein